MNAAAAPARFTEALQLARSRNASDVHVCAGRAPVLRVDGVLESYDSPPVTQEDIEHFASAVFTGASAALLDRTGDVSVTCRFGEPGRVRVHAYRTAAGIALAMRLLAARAPALESLGLPPVVAQFAQRRHGLVVFTGPTGSGKTTALASLVDRINRTAARHIVTIEDPVEYEHEPHRSSIEHREVGAHVPSFAQAVLGALRADPDVILVGEMRDAATMHAALTAAETGHLVLTTLHTADAPQSIDRIVGAFAGEMQEQVRIQLAQTLAGIVCVRLVPRCSGKGRRCAAEVLIGNDAARNLIREGKTHQLRSLIETSRASGMQTLESHLLELVASGDVAAGEARAAAVREDALRLPQAVR